MELLNIDLFSPRQYTQVITSWLMAHFLQIVVIIIVAFVTHRLAHLLIVQAIQKSIKSGKHLSREAEKKREDTLISIFRQVLAVSIWLIAGLMVLSELGIDTTPLIAGAGVVGIALGFGGQYLIKDIISGFFIILENQYRVGDVVCFDKVCGLVENINLRTTILRDLDGTVHHVPNGEVKVASNLSKDFAQVNLNVGVAYNTDIEQVIKVINQTGKELARDSRWKSDIIEAPQFLRVDDFGESEVVVKILGKTKPIRQWDVTGELRKRLKQAFDREGIEIPFPQRVVHLPVAP